jgi:hypothetical protein
VLSASGSRWDAPEAGDRVKTLALQFFAAFTLVAVVAGMIFGLSVMGYPRLAIFFELFCVCCLVVGVWRGCGWR